MYKYATQYNTVQNSSDNLPSYLWRIRRSLDNKSAAMLVHNFVTPCDNYCNAVYAEAPKKIINKLQRVLNTAAHMVSDAKKYDRGFLTLLHDNSIGFMCQKG